MSEKEEQVFNFKQDPYNHMMRMLFGKWRPFILHAVEEDDFTNFSRFTKQLPITQKVLTENLRQLEEDGLIYKTVRDTKPPQTEYRLTEAGKKMIPLLNMVYKLGWEDMKEKHIPIDALGEMWHGYRERDEDRMHHPYDEKKTKS